MVLLVAVVSMAAPIDEQSPTHTYQTWFDAVTTHVPGESDEAAARIAPWSFTDLVGVLSELRNGTWTDRTRLIERGLVLHADIAILNRDNTGYNLPPGVDRATVLDDGRAVGQMAGTVHWDFARRLVNEIPERSERLRIARRFYRATGAVLQQWGEYPELTRHLPAGRKLLGEDAVLLLYEGTMHQAYAGTRMQRFFESRRREEARGPVAMRTLPPVIGGPSGQAPELPPSFPSVRESRARAEQLFRRALAIDVALPEARIRLAHVLGDRGRHAEAAAELKRLARGKLPRLLDYYASLVAGRESRALGQLEAARAAFEHAARIYPSASAPKLGLSELAIAAGDREASLSHLVTRAADAPDGMVEPWWWIDRVHDPSAGVLIAELRQSAAP
jgi:tetratricopeptide (TPR) repeat protein